MSTALFMTLGKIKGESTDSDKKAQIEFDHFNLNVSNNARCADSGKQIGNLGFPTFNSITCFRSMDSASVPILDAVAQSQSQDKITIEVCTINNNTKHVYAKVELELCYISNIDISFTKGADKPQESFTLAFSKIKWTYSGLDTAGKAISPVAGGWDLTKNQKV